MSFEGIKCGDLVVWKADLRDERSIKSVGLILELRSQAAISGDALEVAADCALVLWSVHPFKEAVSWTPLFQLKVID